MKCAPTDARKRPAAWFAGLVNGWNQRVHRVCCRARDSEHLAQTLRLAQDSGVIDLDALTMLEGVLHVSDMQVRDIMVPRSQMDVVPRDAGLARIVDDLVESAHSRFPVLGDSRDEVVGILLAKDVLRFVGENPSDAFDIQEVLRPAVFVPESKRLNVLLKEFRLNRNHMAIVVDEYGGIAGLVTIEDVLEQIVGNIEDEHDVEDYLTQIMKHPSGRFTIKALTPLEEFNTYFATTYDENDFDTVGGLVLNRFGQVPRRGEQVAFDGFQFRVLRADARRLHLLEMRRATATSPDEADAGHEAGSNGGYA